MPSDVLERSNIRRQSRARKIFGSCVIADSRYELVVSRTQIFGDRVSVVDGEDRALSLGS
ncbi:hypothetical protein ACFVZD_21570 [Streptomyces sp. NPDC058287]|uniref:hypothetical protein n=1 Tax=unclassified Streptomyces TaxID=2593676 RepID=UPI0036E10FBC